MAVLTGAVAFCGIQCIRQMPIPAVGLQLWLKADAGVTLNGSTVSKWVDQSGNGNHAIQLDAGRQPVLVSKALNGKPALRFDGFDDRLGLTGSKRMSQISLFMVFRGDSGGNRYDPIGFGDMDADGQIWGVDMQSSSTVYSPDTVNIFAGFNGVVHAVVPHSAAFSLWHNISVVTDSVMWSTTVRASGVDAQVMQAENNMFISVPIGNSSGTGVGGIAGADGVRLPTGRTVAKCDIAEVILYDTVLPDSLRRSVEQYLAARYDLSQMIKAGKQHAR